MARTKGAKSWSTLARGSNQEAFDHFISRGKDRDHAYNLVRRLREQYTDAGDLRRPEIKLPRNFWDMPGRTPVTETETETEITETETETETKEENTEIVSNGHNTPIAPATDESRALFRFIEPAFNEKIQPYLAAELARIQAETAPVKVLCVVRDKVETVIEGVYHTLAPKLIGLVSTGQNVMLVGPAGCGKTTLAHTAAKALGRELTMISCSAGMSEASLLGRLLPLGENGSFRYVESQFMSAYANGGAILLDEIDGADSNLLLVINAALANGGITIEARAANGLPTYVKRHPNTIIIAAANTWGHGADTQYVGRGALDASTLDRFYRLNMDYDTDLEKQLASADVVSWVHTVRTRARSAKLRQVVSARMITRIANGMHSGLSFEECKADMLASWSADERAKVL